MKPAILNAHEAFVVVPRPAVKLPYDLQDGFCNDDDCPHGCAEMRAEIDEIQRKHKLSTCPILADVVRYVEELEAENERLWESVKGFMAIGSDSVGVFGYEPERVTKWNEFPEIEAACVAISTMNRGEPHPDDLAVDRFAAAMKAKLAKKRGEGLGGWEDKDDCSQLFLSQLLREHVEKGDPVDVGNLAMMLHQREERISSLLETLQGE